MVKCDIWNVISRIFCESVRCECVSGTNNEKFAKDRARSTSPYYRELSAGVEKKINPHPARRSRESVGKRHYEKYGRRRNFGCPSRNMSPRCFYCRGIAYKLSGWFSKTGKFLRSCRDRWLPWHRRGEGTDWRAGAGQRGWLASGGRTLLKVAARKKGRSRPGERVRLHAQPRYEVSLRAISNGLHWASANIKFDVHDYCGPPGEICGDADFAGCGGE